MKTKPMQFKGSCAACGRVSEKARGGIEVCATNRDFGSSEWICLTCAKRLAGMLLNAVDKCRAKIRSGMMYRSEKWQKKGVAVK